MSRYRKFEVITERIAHLEEILTINQALALLVCDSLTLRSKEERFQLCLSSCRLEYMRIHSIYSDDIGKKLYKLLCDIFNEKPRIEQVEDLDLYLCKTLQERGKEISIPQYEKLALTIAPYYAIPATTLKTDLKAHFNQKMKQTKPVSQPVISKKPQLQSKKTKKHKKLTFFKTKFGRFHSFFI